MTSKLPLTEHPIAQASSPDTSSFWEDCLSAINALASRLIRFLTAGHEPYIQTVHLRNGQTLWIAYDPVSNTSFRSTSEADISGWLDRRWHDR